eukprot:6751652-Prorocentrum_lima.AAC.1
MKRFQRDAHTDIQQRVRTLTLDLLDDSFVHTLLLGQVSGSSSGRFSRRQFILFPLFRDRIRIEYAMGLGAVFRHGHFQRAFDFRRFCQGQLAAEIGK